MEGLVRTTKLVHCPYCPVPNSRSPQSLSPVCDLSRLSLRTPLFFHFLSSTSSSPPLTLLFLNFHSPTAPPLPFLPFFFLSPPLPFSHPLVPQSRLPRLHLGSGAYSLPISPTPPRRVRPNPPATFARFVKKQCGRGIIAHNCLHIWPPFSPGYTPLSWDPVHPHPDLERRALDHQDVQPVQSRGLLF